MSNGLSYNLLNDTVVVNDDLKISFCRTIRVPDNDAARFLPPDLGTFPLKRVSQYSSKLPKAMADKGRYLFPMFQKEAMWINFEAKSSYFIEIFVGASTRFPENPLSKPQRLSCDVKPGLQRRNRTQNQLRKGFRTMSLYQRNLSLTA